MDIDKIPIDKIPLEELKNNSEKYARECTTDDLLGALNLCGQDNNRKEVIIDILKIQQDFEQKENKEFNDSGKMDIYKIPLEELKNNSEKYARECTTDDLLGALNLCGQDDNRKEVIIDILKIQQDFERKQNKEFNNGDLNLSILLDKFHTDIDTYSLKHRLMEIGEKNPELSFKYFLLRIFTLLLENKPLSEEEHDILEEFNINVSGFALLNRLKVDLELDLKKIYSTETGNFIDMSSNKLTQDGLHLYQKVARQNLVAKHANGRLEGKKPIPGHCAFNDSPSGLKLYGEDLIEYDLGDEYIPCQNHATSLELLNKVEAASVEELEKMYIEKYGELLLSVSKFTFEDNEEKYLLCLKESLLTDHSFDVLNMYKTGDRFVVVKATYKGKAIRCREYVNCWFVDVYSEKTKKIYRVLSY